MATPCPVCGGKMHMKIWRDKETNQRVWSEPFTCPLEDINDVKMKYSPEIRGLLPTLFDFKDIAKTKEGLEAMNEMIPKETPINKFVTVENSKGVYTCDLLMKSSMQNFMLHFSRFLIDNILERRRNGIRFVDSNVELERGQFSYIYCTASLIKDLQFKNSYSDEDRFKSLNCLKKASILIYPLGLEEINQKNWGDVILGVLNGRAANGLPNWIIQSKDIKNCQETQTSPKLVQYLKDITTVTLKGEHYA